MPRVMLALVNSTNSARQAAGMQSLSAPGFSGRRPPKKKSKTHPHTVQLPEALVAAVYRRGVSFSDVLRLR